MSMIEPESFLAEQYLSFEAKTITWIEFLETIIPIFQTAHRTDEVLLFQEFAEIMRTTSYPEEKTSYQSVEIHYTYSTIIDSLREA